MRIFGIAGYIGAGKDTLADVLILHGFKKYSYSDIIRDELEKSGTPATRENLQNMGNIMRERFGKDVLSRRLYEKILAEGGEKNIVSGIRDPKEAEFFKRMEGFKLVWVEADKELRMKRVFERSTKKDPTTEKGFHEMEEREKMLGVEEVRKLADVVVQNNGTVEELEKKAKEVFGV